MSWLDEKACTVVTAEYDPFFEEDNPRAEAEAKAICATCPVSQQCLTTALRHREEYGIFGGLNPAERDELVDGVEDDLLKVSQALMPREAPAGTVAAIEAKYGRRHRRAQYCYERLVDMEPGTVKHQDVWMNILVAVMDHPDGNAEDLCHYIGKSPTLFNQRLRECFKHFELDLAVL